MNLIYKDINTVDFPNSEVNIEIEMEQVKNYEFIDKNIEKVCTNKQREDDDEYIKMLKKWVDNSINAINSQNRPFSLLLVGENRESMLNWAKSLGRHIYWQGKKDLRKWDPDANFIILDGFKWNDKEVPLTLTPKLSSKCR